MQDLRLICLLLASTFIVTGSGCTVATLTAHDSPSSFSSTGYPIKFPPSICQKWVIKTLDSEKRLVLETVDFKLPPDNATQVNVIDPGLSNKTLRGSDRIFYQSSADILIVDFHTRDLLFTRGFKFNFYQVTAGAPCSREIGASFTRNDLYSPGYPHGYFNNLQCNYTIRSKYPGYRVEINSWESEIEDSYTCQYDRLTFIDFINNGTSEYVVGTICGDEHPSFQSSGSILKIMFSTNQHKTNKGFRIRYRAITDDRNSLRTQASRLDSYLISPGYPHSGLRNISMDWYIRSYHKTVELTTVDCDLPASEPNCTGHSVEVSGVLPMSMNGSQILNETSRKFDEIFCGNSTPSFASEKTTMITLESTISLYSRGLVMKHRLKEEPLESVQCGGSLSASNITKNLQSPGYPRASLQNQTCTWKLSATEATDVIVLQLIDLDIDLSEDSFKIYDGVIPEDFNLIENWQGQRAGEYVVSSGTALTVVYTLDGSDNGRGVSFNYTSVDGGQLSSMPRRIFTLQAKESDSYLNSPGFMMHFRKNMTLYITIEADEDLNIRVEFLKSNVPGSVSSSGTCSEGSVTVYDGPSFASPMLSSVTTDSGTVCGQQEPVFISSGSSLFLVYTTGHSGYKDQGFLLKYREDMPSEFNNERKCGAKLMATKQHANFTSPRYPLNYVNGVSCLWTINPADNTSFVRLVPTDIHIETSANNKCNYDSLTVFDGAVGSGSVTPTIVAAMCGNKGKTVQSSVPGGPLSVVFQSDATNTDKGFLLEYFETNEPPPCVAESKVSYTPYYYETPGNALNTIPANTSCTWLLYYESTIMHIKIDIKSNDVMTDVINGTCSSYFLDIYDGESASSLRIDRLCGKIDRSYIGSGKKMLVKLFTGNQPVHGGYTITFKATSTDLCGSSYLTSYTSPSVLTSPYYPRSYPSNTECVWHISATGVYNQVVIEVVAMDMDGTEGCGEDYLIAYDSYTTYSPFDRWCGKTMPKYQSTSGSITIKFHSSNALSTPKTGFKLKYWTKNVPYEPDYVNVGAIVGGVIGGLAFIALIFVVIFCVTQKPFSPKPILRATGPSYPQALYQPGQQNVSYYQPQVALEVHSNPTYISSDNLSGSSSTPSNHNQGVTPQDSEQSEPTFTKF